MKLSVLPQSVMYKSSCDIYFAKVLSGGENSAGVICIRYTINVNLCRGTCEPDYFKLGMMPEGTRLHSLFSV